MALWKLTDISLVCESDNSKIHYHIQANYRPSLISKNLILVLMDKDYPLLFSSNYFAIKNGSIHNEVLK
jgi:hypothetical protein